ncbi:MAG: RNase adapter RapZ [Chloroflexi bacterium]|nr:MAG: RNase adapter RapZ [Chloroflexota bacterium]
MLAMADPSTPLDVTVVTGMSGAGRSATADVLEDLGFFVIDNLPPALIPKVAELGRDRQGSRFALVVDTRAGEYLPDLESALAELRETGARTRVLFLDAADEVLVRRFDETRRRHPVAESHRVSEGIARERELLEEIKGQADIVIDTSELNVHELRDRLREIIGEPADVPSGLQINVVSFGYKHGLPLDVDLVFDCRFLPNPHWIESLRPLPGTDAKVRRYVMKQEETQAFLEELSNLFELLLPAYVREGKSYLSIGVGCTGGRHRSVVIAAEIARVLERLGFPARVHHRDLERE